MMPTTLEGWRERAEHLERECIKARDRENIAARERRLRLRDAETAYRNRVWGDVLQAIKLYIWAEVRHELDPLIHHAETVVGLRDARKSQARDDAYGRLSSYVVWARAALAQVDREQLDQLPPFGELRRVRDAVREQGQRLHAAHGTNDGTTCRCPGCELIRATYDFVEVAP